jgi:23S rRNA (pseudouridine1915-N3)-methyltransferase
VNIDIFCVGHTPKPHEARWIEDYLGRASKLARLRLTRIREKPGRTADDAARRTWGEIAGKIPEKTFVVLLDPSGTIHTTERFAELLDRADRSNKKGISFVIGGPYGLPPEARASADALVSLTPLTLPHRIALLLLSEQLYRVLSWRAGTPYHHGS